MLPLHHILVLVVLSVSVCLAAAEGVSVAAFQDPVDEDIAVSLETQHNFL